MFRNLKISTKIIFLAFIISTLFGITNLVTIYSLVNFAGDISEVFVRYEPAAHFLTNSLIGIQEEVRIIEEYGNGYLSFSEAKQSLEQKDHEIEGFLEVLSKVGQQENIPSQLATIRQYQTQLKKMLEEIYEIDNASAVESGKNADKEVVESEGSIKREKLEELDSLYDEMKEWVSNAVAADEEVKVYRTKAAISFYQKTNKIVLLSLSLTVLLVVALSIYIIRRISSSIASIQQTAEEISRGNLSKRLNLESGDEFGQLSKVINTMLDELQSSQAHFKELSHQLEVKVEEVNHKNQSLEDTKMAMINLLDDSRTLEINIKNERDRAETIINSMGDGLMVIDKDYKLRILNEIALNMFNLHGKNWRNQLLSNVTEMYKGQDRLTLEQRPVTISLKSGKSVKTTLEDDYNLKTEDGRFIPISITTSALKTEKGITGAVIVFRDITSEKFAKQNIEKQVIIQTMHVKEEQARLEASINSLNFGFVITDKTQKIITMNETAKHLLSHPGNMGLTKSDIFREFSINDVANYLSSAIDLKAEIDEVMLRKIPSVREIALGNIFLLIRITPIIKVEEGIQVIGAVIVVENITERKLLERTRDEFFSIASHELRTPLTAIRGNTSMIEQFFSDQITDPEFKEMIDDIHKSSTRLISIVNDFLNTSRLELGKMQFKHEKFNLLELSQEVIKEYETTGSVKMVYLHIDPPTVALPSVMGDRDRLKQVLINLVGNGIKFTQQGGITIRFELKGGFVKTFVSDTGKGISKESQMLLFRKFQQASESIYTRDATQGTGLGLYISKLMMEGMGGSIALEQSELGKGSTFSFLLPIAKAEES